MDDEQIQKIVTDNEYLVRRCRELEVLAATPKDEPTGTSGELITLFRSVLSEVRGTSKTSYKCNSTTVLW